MRHSGAGLAIPDFPLVFGGLIPPELDFAIAVNYLHRMGALAVVVAIAFTLARALRVSGGGAGLRGLAIALAVLVTVQVSLGGAVILTGKAVVPNTAHVATGATLLAAVLLMTLTSWRLAGPQRARFSQVAVASSASAATQPDATGGV